MSRHVHEIKDMLFDQPEFDSDEEKVVKKKKKKVEKKSTVETIVFRDPAKKKKVVNVSRSIQILLMNYFYL